MEFKTPVGFFKFVMGFVGFVCACLVRNYHPMARGSLEELRDQKMD